MVIKSEKFKEISKEYQTLSKFFQKADIRIDYKYDAGYEVLYFTNYTGLEFKNIGKMYAYSKVRPIPLWGSLLRRSNDAHAALSLELGLVISDTKYTLASINPDHARQFKTLKFTPSATPEAYQPRIIEKDPLEITDGDYTYRLLTCGQFTDRVTHMVAVISRNDDKLYDYLDKGFYIRTLEYTEGFKKMYKHIVANAYDVNVAHIFAMCVMEPKLTDMLQHGCFINVHTAELTRLKMTKKLNEGKIKTKVDQLVLNAIDTDYKKNSTLTVVGKLVEGAIEKTTLNNITFTKSSATYEQVSVEADDLLDVLYKELNFNGEFDIYTITSIYAAHMEKLMNKGNVQVEQDKAEDAEPVVQPDQEAQPEAAEKKTNFPVVKINGIAITTALSSTHQRYINDVRINKDELSKAISRASCYRSADDYKLFLKSISRMSIKYHDIIANGLPVKIHSTISREEYADTAPSASAPVLKLCIDTKDKYFKLQIDKDRAVRVNLSKLIKRVDTLNRKTNGKSYYSETPGYLYKRSIPRNYNWCAEELVGVLVDCCTFQKVQKREDGTEALVAEVLINREDIIKLLDVVNEQKRQIIERSKEFLATAVKLTGATIIEFLGKRAYLVKGTLREYAVVIENAKVYDYATKQYRCIVNDRHYAGAGYDDIAARLLALKNDSTMQEHIGTLRGAAQPGAENVHNDYVPERDHVDKLDELVTKALTSKVENIGQEV